MAYETALQTVLDREPEPAGGVVGTDVDYESDGERFRGYLAVPADADGAVKAVAAATGGGLAAPEQAAAK